MLQLTLESGQCIQRVFAGFIVSEGDLANFIEEVKSEFHSRKRNKEQPMMCEVWEYAGRIISRRKLPTEKEEKTAVQV
ncbi:MAG: hypothetical protein [Siphoviridae sp. cttb18]|nr:MAG: hypothetical protein [Siphoviridae sp. cttb18]